MHWKQSIRRKGWFKIIAYTFQEVNVQINLEFLLVRWIVFVLANLKLSIKEGEGTATGLAIVSAVPLLLIARRVVTFTLFRIVP